jgi:hypothetical protein
MAHVTLPSDHAERDFDLAKAIARELELVELHVFWPPASPDPRVEPPRAGGLLRALAAVGRLFERLGGRLVGQVPSRPPRS